MEPDALDTSHGFGRCRNNHRWVSIDGLTTENVAPAARRSQEKYRQQ
jgi:hypothetical protein